MIFKKDNFWLGVVLGIIAPLLGFMLFKVIKYPMFSLSEMYQWIRFNHNILTAFISASLFANAAIFTLYVNARIDKTAKGIFVVTLIYAVVALLIKFLG
ncbi:MAG: hypothetical protein HY305_02585 [Sphingobacteriales bacterium]|nr:hypothetical protein [Sphingobacteriales bacterium]